MSAITMALLGSGEFEPWSEPVDRRLLERSRNPTGVALVAPTAAAHEGEESFSLWAAKGLEHYASLGLPAEVLALRTREDAHREDLIARLDEASFVFFSGGNPFRLADALRETPFWAALATALGDGLPYAGCSAGVACLMEVTYDSETQDFAGMWKPGLGFVRDTIFGPHWDIVDTWVPGASEFILGSVLDGQAFVGLDEETAIVGNGRSWTTFGRQAIHVRRGGTWSTYRSGDEFELELALEL